MSVSTGVVSSVTHLCRSRTECRPSGVLPARRPYARQRGALHAPLATDDPFTWLPWRPREERPEEEEQGPPRPQAPQDELP